MRNKGVYSCSIKICALGFSKLLESNFCVLLVIEAFSLQKVVAMLEEEVISWREGRWVWQMGQNLAAQFVPLWKQWLQRAAGHRRGGTGPFWWPVPAAGPAVFGASRQLAEHTSQMSWFCQDSESCSGSDTTKQWPWPFFGASLALGRALEFLLGPATELVIASCMKVTFHCVS